MPDFSLRHELGIDVPGDLSVVGFDDIPLTALPEFALTTLRQPIDNLVRNSVRLINELVQDHAGRVENIALAPKLIERGTVEAKHQT